jgi:hypothetical protein
MSKRLQVLLEESELRQIERLARQRRVTVTEWVHQALAAAVEANRAAIGKKLQAVRAAAAHNFPTADIDEMLRQIERGHLDSP